MLQTTIDDNQIRKKIYFRTVRIVFSRQEKGVKKVNLEPWLTYYETNQPTNGLVGWDCKIHQLHLCRGVRLPQWVSWYDTKQSDVDAPAMLELWGMWSNHRSQVHSNWIVWSRTAYMYKMGLALNNLQWPSIVEDNPKTSFSIAATLRCKRGYYSFPWISPPVAYWPLTKLSIKRCT